VSFSYLSSGQLVVAGAILGLFLIISWVSRRLDR
jgi:hypothetical protein